MQRAEARCDSVQGFPLGENLYKRCAKPFDQLKRYAAALFFFQPYMQAVPLAAYTDKLLIGREVGLHVGATLARLSDDIAAVTRLSCIG